MKKGTKNFDEWYSYQSKALQKCGTMHYRFNYPHVIQDEQTEFSRAMVEWKGSGIFKLSLYMMSVEDVLPIEGIEKLKDLVNEFNGKIVDLFNNALLEKEAHNG